MISYSSILSRYKELKFNKVHAPSRLPHHLYYVRWGSRPPRLQRKVAFPGLRSSSFWRWGRRLPCSRKSALQAGSRITFSTYGGGVALRFPVVQRRAGFASDAPSLRVFLPQSFDSHLPLFSNKQKGPLFCGPLCLLEVGGVEPPS